MRRVTAAGVRAARAGEAAEEAKKTTEHLGVTSE
jgi:hypothetical protein